MVARWDHRRERSLSVSADKGAVDGRLAKCEVCGGRARLSAKSHRSLFSNRLTTQRPSGHSDFSPPRVEYHSKIGAATENHCEPRMGVYRLSSRTNRRSVLAPRMAGRPAMRGTRYAQAASAADGGDRGW